MEKFKIKAPFSDDVFEDIYPSWLFWNAEECIQCHIEHDNMLVFDAIPLHINQNNEYDLKCNAIGCFLFVHKKFGVLYCTCAFAKSSLVILNPKIAYNKERCAFRLGDVDNIIEEDVSVINISGRGCLLNCESKIGKIKKFHLNLKKRLEVIAFCVHSADGKSGWCFPLWRCEDEKYYRIVLGEDSIPALAQRLQHISAQRAKITTTKR